MSQGFETNSTVIATDLGVASSQYPIPVDGDSIHAKDIDVDRSDMGNFSGSVLDFFDNLHSENTDITANNPKEVTIHFNRTLVIPLVGLGSSEGGSFSNVKIIGVLSGDVETTLFDNSLDNTDRTTQFFPFPNAGLNALKIQFHTVDTIAITNIYAPKIQVVSAISETSTKFATSYGNPYLLNGGSDSMKVAGTLGAPIDFEYEHVGLTPFRWHRSFVELNDGASAFDPDKFGGLTALTNGCQIIVSKAGVETVMETWKANSDITLTMYDFSSQYKVGAYMGRWTITSDMGAPITLFAGDKIIMRIRDTLTGLDAFRFRIKGSK